MSAHKAVIELLEKDHDWRSIVFKLAQSHPTAVVRAMAPPWQKEALQWLAAGKKFEAIKACRNATGMTLIDAKATVEAL